ncbi:ATP-dependent endonuclease [Thermodesulfobacteriota bacterium]
MRQRVELPGDSRQVFLTSHSTHITAATELDSIVCIIAPTKDHGVSVSYPGKVFSDDSEGRASKKYVERFLDATKSNMLFAKGVIFVEGIAEQLLLPCFAEYIKVPLEEHHIAVVAVGGSTFKHFLPIFGATPDPRKGIYMLESRVACLADGDPMRKKEGDQKRKKCLPHQIDCLVDQNNRFPFSSLADRTEYYPISSVVLNLQNQCNSSRNVKVFHSVKTLEYDLAADNQCSEILIRTVPKHQQLLRSYANDPEGQFGSLIKLLDR